MRTDKITFNIFILIAINMFMFTAKAQNSYNAKQLEMLFNKTWCEIDSDNGTKLNSELFLKDSILFLQSPFFDNGLYNIYFIIYLPFSFKISRKIIKYLSKINNIYPLLSIKIEKTLDCSSVLFNLFNFYFFYFLFSFCFKE